METPVIYFYNHDKDTFSAKERQIDVEVKFPQGLVTEWFPQVSGFGPTFAMDLGLVYALVVIAVTVLGWIGEISLAVVAQMGFGLIVLNYLQRHHWPFPLILLAVVVSSIPFSVILGLFALRLRGINFVIASLAFGYLVQRSLLAQYMGAGASEKGTWVRILSPHVEGKLVRGGERLDVGDRVRVELVATDVERGYIDFARVAGGG